MLAVHPKSLFKTSGSKLRLKWRVVSFAIWKTRDIFLVDFLAQSGKILPIGKSHELHYSVFQTGAPRTVFCKISVRRSKYGPVERSI